MICLGIPQDVFTEASAFKQVFEYARPSCIIYVYTGLVFSNYCWNIEFAANVL